MTKLEVKERLKVVCADFVKSKLNTILKTVQSNQEALESESKSSAGDKHETGRAMLQLEMEKAGQQLSEVDQMKLVVEKINSAKICEAGSLGSVVKTESVNYFIGISVGKIELDNEIYFVISPGSPIGKLLLGKVKNDIFLFQESQTKILNIW
ncbi:3-oxoacyl-ACP synthase [Flavicella sp.]|uniref:3-oxoacyl-ACP synthase n=1 Tax=Flavicella sp. TaxID=2957742 RepID=UPI00301732F1